MKTYMLKLKSKEVKERFLEELSAWGVAPEKYRERGLLLILTEDSNVVDVLTETFTPSAYSITSFTGKKKAREAWEKLDTVLDQLRDVEKSMREVVKTGGSGEHSEKDAGLLNFYSQVLKTISDEMLLEGDRV